MKLLLTSLFIIKCVVVVNFRDKNDANFVYNTVFYVTTVCFMIPMPESDARSFVCYSFHDIILAMLLGILVWLLIQYIPRNMHTVFALLCFVVVIHWLIFPYPSSLLDWHCGNLTIAPVPAKQPWWIWINASCEFIMNDCITTTKQSTTKPCAYFLGYTVCVFENRFIIQIHVFILGLN